MTWVDVPLITPDIVEDAAILVLRDHHAEHLAAHERRLGLQAEALERLKTVSHLSAQGEALSGDALPAALIGSPGTYGEPERNEDDALDVVLALGLEVVVIGQRRRETARRRDVTTWCAIECLLQRLPRATGPVSAIRLRDVEVLEDGQAQRIRGSARVLFEVTVPNAVSLLGLPATDDDRWAAGTPGGAPGAAYTPPVALPAVEQAAAEVTHIDDEDD